MEQEFNKKEEAKGIWKSIVEFVKKTIALEASTDKIGTIKEVKSNISMYGHTAWILVFSIIIASIGLNVSSTAVVIGAMLISPLMGPILGAGMAIGINDVDMLRKSIINLGVMVVLSLITSSLFFSIPLFDEATPEILARTKPDVRDVLIALTGGLSLIVAISRPSPQTNTVAGVAIATALMPPLCTAGYGLGTGNWAYFGGAMFLFTINTIFIALATFVVVKYLNFPIVKYIDQKSKKRISQIAMVVATVVFGFSIFSFYKLYEENKFKKQAKNFIIELKEEGVSIIADNEENINYRDQSITFYVLGNMIPAQQIDEWKKEMHNYSDLKETKLIVRQKDDSEIQEKVKNLTDLYSQNQQIIASRDASIQDKEKAILGLESRIKELGKDVIPFQQICDEVKINYDGIEHFSFALQFNSNFTQTDTIKIFQANWFDSIPENNIQKESELLKKWLKTRLQLDTLVLEIK